MFSHFQPFFVFYFFCIAEITDNFFQKNECTIRFSIAQVRNKIITHFLFSLSSISVRNDD